MGKIKKFLEHSNSDENDIFDRFESEYGTAYNSQNRFDFVNKISQEGKYDREFVKNTLRSHDFAFKNVAQLDRLSEKRISEYRYNIIQDNAGYMPKDQNHLSVARKAQLDWKQYLEELEVYQLVRFKDTQMNMYDNWAKKAEAGDKDYELMGGIVKTEKGRKGLYDISLTSGIKKVGTFKYLHFDIPEINLDIQKLFGDK